MTKIMKEGWWDDSVNEMLLLWDKGVEFSPRIHVKKGKGGAMQCNPSVGEVEKGWFL